MRSSGSTGIKCGTAPYGDNVHGKEEVIAETPTIRIHSYFIRKEGLQYGIRTESSNYGKVGVN